MTDIDRRRFLAASGAGAAVAGTAALGFATSGAAAADNSYFRHG